MSHRRDRTSWEEENGASDPPPSYDEVVRNRRRSPQSPVETNLDDVDTSEEEQKKLLEFYKKRKEMEEADRRFSEKHNAEEMGNADDEERQEQNQARLQKMVRDLRRSESGPNADAEELEMHPRDLKRSSSFQMALEDGGSSDSDYDDGGAANRHAQTNGAGRVPIADLDEVQLDYVDDIDASAAIRRSYQAALNGEPQDEHRMEQGEETTDEEATKSTSTFGRILKAWSGLSEKVKIFIVLTVLLFIGVVLLVTLLPASFVYVEYHEYAFSRNKITQKIDYSSVYDTGCYLLAPQDELVRFKATAHFVSQKLGVMNKEGMSIKLDIMLQYFLKPDQLEELYRKYHTEYEGVMESLIESTVKNTAVSFKLDEFRLQRQKVEAAIFERLKYVLSGDCCPSCCPHNCKADVSCRMPDCRLPGRCYPGHYVDIKFFQMGEVWIPDEVMNRLLQRVLLQVEAEKELYLQAKAVEEKQTELGVQNILNKAKEARHTAQAESRVIRVRAEADRNTVYEKAYQGALKQMFSQLNLTREDTKLSVMYIRALEDMKDNLFTFNYGVESAMSP